MADGGDQEARKASDGGDQEANKASDRKVLKDVEVNNNGVGDGTGN